MAKVTIDIGQLMLARDKAGEFALTGKAEDGLIQLKKARDEINQLYNDALAKVYELAIDYDKDTKAIDGRKVRLTFSESGSRYVADNLDEVDDEFKTVMVRLRTDTIDDYLKREVELPKGIKLKEDRGVAIRLMVKDNEQTAI